MKRMLPVLLLAAFVSAGPVFAQKPAQGRNIVLGKGQVVNENYFGAGSTVTLSGTVNGDAYVAGGNLLVDGTVNGDLLVAGGQVNVTGAVNGNVRAIGGQVDILGQVQGNVTAAGGSVTIARSASVGGSLVASGGQVSIMTNIPKSATVAGGAVVLTNAVGGNMNAYAGRLTLTSTAIIRGNLTYMSQNRAEVQEGAQVAGKTNYTALRGGGTAYNALSARRFAGSVFLLYKILAGLVACILGWIMIWLFPVFSRRLVQAGESRPGPVILAGLLVLFVTPALIVILLMTVAAIPVAFMLASFYLTYIYLSKIVFALYLGSRINGWMSSRKSPTASLFMGIIAWIILTSLPFVGWLFSLVSLVMGTGIMVVVKQYYFGFLRERKFA